MIIGARMSSPTRCSSGYIKIRGIKNEREELIRLRLVRRQSNSLSILAEFCSRQCLASKVRFVSVILNGGYIMILLLVVTVHDEGFVAASIVAVNRKCHLKAFLAHDNASIVAFSPLCSILSATVTTRCCRCTVFQSPSLGK